MKINWKVRIKNPLFWVQVALAIVTPVGVYYGLTASDFTTWGMVVDTAVKAFGNPYVVFSMLVGIYNASTDPTTAGHGDSQNALSYQVPKRYYLNGPGLEDELAAEESEG